MKQLLTLVTILTLCGGCKKQASTTPAPANSGSHTTSGMNATETALVGTWYLGKTYEGYLVFNQQTNKMDTANKVTTLYNNNNSWVIYTSTPETNNSGSWTVSGYHCSAQGIPVNTPWQAVPDTLKYMYPSYSSPVDAWYIDHLDATKLVLRYGIAHATFNFRQYTFHH